MSGKKKFGPRYVVVKGCGDCPHFSSSMGYWCRLQGIDPIDKHNRLISCPLPKLPKELQNGDV